MTNTQKAVRAIVNHSDHTAAEICRRYGAERTLLTQYLNGDRNMGLNLFLGLCKAAQVDASKILKQIGK